MDVEDNLIIPEPPVLSDDASNERDAVAEYLARKLASDLHLRLWWKKQETTQCGADFEDEQQCNWEVSDATH